MLQIWMLCHFLKFLANLIIFFLEYITNLKFESIKVSLFSKKNSKNNFYKNTYGVSVIGDEVVS